MLRFLDASTPRSVIFPPCGERDFPWKDFPAVLLGDALTTFPLRLVGQALLTLLSLNREEIN